MNCCYFEEKLHQFSCFQQIWSVDSVCVSINLKKIDCHWWYSILAICFQFDLVNGSYRCWMLIILTYTDVDSGVARKVQGVTALSPQNIERLSSLYIHIHINIWTLKNMSGYATGCRELPCNINEKIREISKNYVNRLIYWSVNEKKYLAILSHVVVKFLLERIVSMNFTKLSNGLLVSKRF